LFLLVLTKGQRTASHSGSIETLDAAREHRPPSCFASSHRLHRLAASYVSVAASLRARADYHVQDIGNGAEPR
jgi:hypothetical protein